MTSASTFPAGAAVSSTPRLTLGLSLIGKPLQQLGWLLVGLIIPAIIVGIWQYAVTHQWIAEQLLPPPSLVWQSLLDLVDSGDLWANLAVSLSRIGWSCLIGGGAGLLIGATMGVSAQAKAYLYPTFEVVSQFPVIGWIPLLMIFAGIGEELKIAAIAIAVVVPVAVNTYKGIQLLPRTLLEVARVYEFSLPQVLWRVVLPGALPSLFNGLRQGIMQAWLALVFVELLCASEGIGYLMVWGRQLMQPDLIVVGMVTIGAVGLVLDLVLQKLEQRLQRGPLGAFKS